MINEEARIRTCSPHVRRVLALAGLYVPAAWAAAISVNTTTDEINRDGDCSLREALQAANADTAVDACPAGNGADTIILPAGTYTLTIAGSSTTAGDLDITDDVTFAHAAAIPRRTIADTNQHARFEFAAYLLAVPVDRSELEVPPINTRLPCTDEGQTTRGAGCQCRIRHSPQ